MMEVKEGGYYESRYFEKRPNGSVWISNLGGPKDVVDEWYQTSQIGNRSLEFIEAAVEAGKPFIAYLGPHAPHYRQGALGYIKQNSNRSKGILPELYEARYC